MSLSLIKYELKEINNIANFLDSENNELDEETINDTKESVELLLEEKSEQLELILKELEAKEEKCKEIADFYAKKAKYSNEKKKILKELILGAMQKLDTKKIETATGTFTIRNNTPSLIIDDENLIPQKFTTFVQTKKIEKNEIKKEIKNGVEIPGVHLETTQSLLVK
ncbi:siphovirus Gp157 family protein [Leptotrichia sp. HSP-334]|uniref:Siphovirus Gp157 family protein n=1 Tax=Leptotrichia rugosa TaxID=3239302 RepID=A0AB39VGU0_9FUSO